MFAAVNIHIKDIGMPHFATLLDPENKNVRQANA
jgi:hypothetical protein